MGLFRKIKQASDFEREFLARRSAIENLRKITPETVALENFAIKYDRDRYLKELESTSFKSELKYEMAYTSEGLASFYDKVLEDGVDVWLNKEYATRKWEEYFTFKMGRAMKGDMHGALWCYGFQIGIMCIIENILYYDLVVFPLAVNPVVISLRDKYDAMEKNNGKEIVERVLKRKNK